MHSPQTESSGATYTMASLDTSFTSATGSKEVRNRGSPGNRFNESSSSASGKSINRQNTPPYMWPSRPKHELSWCEYLAERQRKFSLRVLGALVVVHGAVPQLRTYTSKFFTLQAVNSEGMATISIDDIYFVLLWIVNLTFIRSALMDYVLYPLGQVSGVKKHKALVRFAEQGWSAVYYCVAWVWGMMLLSNAEYAQSVDHVWIGWPHHRFSPQLKAYYLVQLAGWLTQIYVLNIEERRRDYHQMFSHHVVTCFLVIGSYYYYYSRAGHLIMMLMDNVDVWLSSAKMLKYAGFRTVCDAMFVLFLLTWITCRHGFYNYITWSAWERAPKLIKFQCFYDVDDPTNTEPVRCFSPTVHKMFVVLLLALQLITLVWLWMILRVIIKMLKGGGAEDNRSDDEDEDEPEDEVEGDGDGDDE